MEDPRPTNDTGSYFSVPPPPVIQPLRDDESASSSRPSLTSPPQRPFHHRPPTPPFPRVATPPRPSTANGKKPAKTLQPKMNTQAYARLLARLSGEYDHEENPPRSRSRSNSTSDTALAAVLRLLALETARADAAERELSRDTETLLSRVREAKEAKERMELDLVCVREELGLYKLQLAVAQTEIDRAQKVVAEVERSRVAAEERSIKDRDRARRLVAERAAEIAREEGRNEGWRQGLERGRWVAWADQEMRRREMEHEDEQQERSSSSSTPTPRQSTRGRNSVGERERTRSTTSIAASRPEVLPVRPRSTSQRPAPNPVPIPSPSHSAEDISILQEMRTRTRTPLDPVQSSPRTVPRSPSVATSLHSRRSIARLPDGYIPTVGPDASISLPPPFELNEQIKFRPLTAGEANPTTSAPDVGGSDIERRNPERQSDRGTQRTPVNIYGSAPGPREPTYDDVFRDRARNRATPAASTASTHMSQYALISPPHDPRERERERTRYEYRDPEQSRRTPQLDHDRAMPSRGEEWRAATPSVIASPTPTTHTRASMRRPTSAMSSIYSMSRGNQNPIEDPISRPQTSNSQRIYSPRVGGTPRLPQEAPGSPSAGPRSGTPNYIYRTARTTENHPLQQSHLPPQPHPSVTISPAEYPNQQPSTPSRPQQRLERSLSSTTVPDISIEPPSAPATNSSGATAVDQLLLTPDHTPTTALPPDESPSEPHEPEQSMIYSPIPHHPGPNSDNDNPTTVVLPDNTLPPGFMPLSPIPSISNFRLDDHDPHRMHEQYQNQSGGGYQIYAAPAVVPDTRGMRSYIPVSSLLFAETPRSPGAAGVQGVGETGGSSTRGEMDFGTSTAPLDRPISLFSEA